MTTDALDPTYAALDHVYAALGDTARRRIVAELRVREPMTTAQIAGLFRTSRWAAMKHLAVLRAAGVVQTLPQGRRRLHYLDRRALEGAIAWLAEQTSRPAGLPSGGR
jgi:DNA-binding transcriptional ArsR family regulator